MKSTHILLSAMLLMAANSSSYAQWSTTSSNHTSGKLGIGMTAAPTNAALRIEGVTATGSCTGIFGPTHVPYFPDPELWINRNSFTSSAGCSVPSANFFQITTFDPYGFPSTTRTLDVINPSGWVGILQPKPTQPLDVAGNALIEQNLNVTKNATINGTLQVGGGSISMAQTSDTWRSIEAKSTHAGLGIFANTSSSDGPTIEMYGKSNTGSAGEIRYISNGNAGANYGHIFYNYGTTATSSTPVFSTSMAITNGGQVLIGSALINVVAPFSSMAYLLPSGYNLCVAGGILTDKLKVATVGGTYWSDFVFNKSYKLMSLNEVEEYVTENKHLPEIPSASEVAKDGIDVANMDAKLLQKIEELTLYVIQQQKQIDKQNKEIESLKKRMD